MMAINHALTGAILGLTVDNPVLAPVAAFASHFALDAIPHYDPPKPDGDVVLFRSRRFIGEQLIINGALCILLVLLLFVTKPIHWLQAGLCAFVATSPDLFWIPRFKAALEGKPSTTAQNPFLRFHRAIQWLTGPKLIVSELLWAVANITIILKIT